MEAFIQTLRDAQTTNLLNLTSLMIRTCAYGRANVHLYEYRPRVSILLQVGQSISRNHAMQGGPTSLVSLFLSVPMFWPITPFRLYPTPSSNFTPFHSFIGAAA